MPLQPLISCWHMTLGPTDTTPANKTNVKQASLSWHHPHDKLGPPMAAQATPNMSPNSPFTNYLHDQGRQTPSRPSPHLWWAWANHQTRGLVSVLMKEGVNVFKEEDVLITCKGKPILIGIQDNQEWYQIPLMQQQGHWQLWHPSKQVWKALRQANSIYDLPLTEQPIKWMHATCG